jgi:hypothetical protein
MNALLSEFDRLVVSLPAEFAFALLALLVWSLVWKGIALWKAARLSHRKWFIALLVVNTLGLLEIAYIFLVARKEEAERVGE